MIGKPTTGIKVCAATTPGKCAAFPAAAIITSVLFSISDKNSNNCFGVLCADSALTTTSIPYPSNNFIPSSNLG